MAEIGLSDIEDLVGGEFTTEVADDAAKAATRARSGSKATYYKFKSGSNVVRLLPALAGEESPIVVVWQHFLKNYGGSGRILSFNCPEQMGVERCPACEHRRMLETSGNPADAAKAKEYVPRVRAFARAIDRQDEAAGVQILPFPKTVLDQLREIRNNEDVYGENYTHPLDGADILVVRKDGDRTEYTCSIYRKSQAKLSTDLEQIRAWLDPNTAPDLARMAQVMTFEQIRALGDKIKSGAANALTTKPAPKAIAGDFGSGTADEKIGGQDGVDADLPF